MKYYKFFTFSIIIFFFLFVTSCITILWGSKLERAEDYKITNVENTTPSQLILQYTGIAPNEKRNYVVVSWESGCPYCSSQIENMSILHEKYKNNFIFIAINNEDSLKIAKNFRKLNVNEAYNFPSFINQWGLRSRLRNLYKNNTEQEKVTTL